MKRKRAVRYLNKFSLFLTIFGLFIAQTTMAQNATTSSDKPKTYRVKVLEVLPHDINSYTQGLFFHNQQLYESAGQYGESKFRKVDIKKGTTLRSIEFPAKYFAEGSTVIGERLYILTWMERVVFVYDINTFKPLGTLFNQKEGWGLTTDGKQLIMSDGSSFIYFIDPLNFKEKSKIEVKSAGRKVTQINELEYINGNIWANEYGTDNIHIIDPKSGTVKATIDCKNLLPDNLRTAKTDVLNGIAYNPATKQIYITGKLWPKMYRIQIPK
ncbi:MAG: glutaminyl-peptide cyclotransferase [Bacteroidales bacterium]